MIEEFSFTNVVDNMWGIKTYHVAMWAPNPGDTPDKADALENGLVAEFAHFYNSHGVELHATPGPFCMHKTKDDEGVVFIVVPKIDMKALEYSFKCINNFLNASPTFEEMVDIYRELMKRIPNGGLFE